MSKWFGCVGAASIFLGLISSNAAQASVVEFSSLAAWDAAVPSSTTISFNGGTSFTGGGTTTSAGGVNFSVARGEIFQMHPPSMAHPSVLVVSMAAAI
jgi:hypothetical protein